MKPLRILPSAALTMVEREVLAQFQDLCSRRSSYSGEITLLDLTPFVVSQYAIGAPRRSQKALQTRKQH